jgi:HNH endonuclease
MKTIRITAFEEKWLRKALQEEIDSFEEWEATDNFTKKDRKELELLRKFSEELPFRLTNAPLRPTNYEMREAQRLIREGSIWIPFCGCWLCEGNLMKNGYGRFQFNNCRISAHRLSYLAFRGPIPEGICVLHNCDTPSCVNPEHLFLGTRVDNMADKIAKGRQTKGKKHWLYGYSVKGERHPMFGRFGENGTGTKLTKNQELEPRARAATREEAREAWAKVKKLYASHREYFRRNWSKK